jgi:hypothetical protein
VQRSLMLIFQTEGPLTRSFVTVVAALFATAVIVAGCGGGTKTVTTNNNTGTTSTSQGSNSNGNMNLGSMSSSAFNPSDPNTQHTIENDVSSKLQAEGFSNVNTNCHPETGTTDTLRCDVTADDSSGTTHSVSFDVRYDSSTQQVSATCVAGECNASSGGSSGGQGGQQGGQGGQQGGQGQGGQGQ